MVTLLLFLGASLLPALGIERVSVRSLTRVTRAWQWGLLALGIAWVGLREPWLGVIGAYLLWWWPQPAARDALARDRVGKAGTVWTWAAIAGTWFLALELPAWAWAWLPAVWGAWAWLCSGVMVWQAWKGDSARIRGWWGLRSVAGGFLALVIPLLPPWAWIGPAVGVWLSGPSWLALAALGVSGIVRWPNLVSWGLLGALAGGLALIASRRVSVAGRAIGEWTPRGDSLDSIYQRLALLRLTWQQARSERTWLMGTGPGTTKRRHFQAHVRGQLAEATGTLHNEPVQLVSEYGVAGLIALLFFLQRVGSGLTWGDPYSAAVVSGLVLASGTMALRVAPLGVMWLMLCAEVVRG